MVDFGFSPGIQTGVNNTPKQTSQNGDMVSTTQKNNVRTMADLQSAIEAGKKKGYGVDAVIKMAENKGLIISDKSNYIREVAKLKSQQDKKQMQSKISGVGRNAVIGGGIMSAIQFGPKINKAIKNYNLDKTNVEGGITKRQFELNKIKQEVLGTKNAQIGFNVGEQGFMGGKISKSLNNARDMAFNSMVTDLGEKGKLRYDDVITHVFDKAIQAQEIKAEMVKGSDTTLGWKSFDMSVGEQKFNPIKNAINELGNIEADSTVTAEKYSKYQNFSRKLDNGTLTLEELTDVISDLDKEGIYYEGGIGKDAIKASKLRGYRNDLDGVLKKILPEVDDVNKTIRGNMAVANDVFGKYIKRINAPEDEMSALRRKISDLTYHIVPVGQIRPQGLLGKDGVKEIAKQEKNLPNKLREYGNLLGMNIKKSGFFPKAGRILGKTLKGAGWVGVGASIIDAASADNTELPKMEQPQNANEASKNMVEGQYGQTNITEPDTNNLIDKSSKILNDFFYKQNKNPEKYNQMIKELLGTDLGELANRQLIKLGEKVDKIPERDFTQTKLGKLIMDKEPEEITKEDLEKIDTLEK